MNEPILEGYKGDLIWQLFLYLVVRVELGKAQ